jgi:hypothetical protein
MVRVRVALGLGVGVAGCTRGLLRTYKPDNLEDWFKGSNIPASLMTALTVL